MFLIMSAPPTPTLAERLAFMVLALCHAIGGQYLGGPLGGKIPVPLMLLITERIKNTRDRFARLAERLVAGTYVPRRFAPRQKPLAPKPRRPSPFRQFGWLDELLPQAVAQQHRAHLQHLLQEPEMLALIEAAPAPIARIIRPLCWMLKVRPPPVLPNPRRPAGIPPSPAPAAYRPPPPRPPAPAPSPPANTLGLPAILFGLAPAPKPA
jgi:hypothetical protein